MGHRLSSESGNCIQKRILYHAIQGPSDFLIYWDPTAPDDIKLLQEYVESNRSVVSQAAHSKVSSASQIIYIYSSKGKDLLIRSAMS